MEQSRRRFQIHLSTAIVLMFAAGALMAFAVPFLKTLFDVMDIWALGSLWPAIVVLGVIVIVGILFGVWRLCEGWIQLRELRAEAKRGMAAPSAGSDSKTGT